MNADLDAQDRVLQHDHQENGNVKRAVSTEEVSLAEYAHDAGRYGECQPEMSLQVGC